MDRQFATFFVADRWYGIDVIQVQEVTKPMPLSIIRLAPNFVKGLINLRGQIATAIGLRELFGLESNVDSDKMSVVCKVEGNLLSLLVDKIGDVVEVSENDFEAAPDTIENEVKSLMSGVYKTKGSLLSVINIENVSKKLNKE